MKQSGKLILSDRCYVDFGKNDVNVDEKWAELSSHQWRTLEYLAINAGNVVTYDQIIENVWENDYIPADEKNAVRNVITDLRNVMKDEGQDIIRTKRGIGYFLQKGPECLPTELPVDLTSPFASEKTNLEKRIVENIWSFYQNLDLEKYADDDGYMESEAKLQELYVFPKLTGDRSWSMASKQPLRYLIEAPNGYGKTALIKSILLSTTYSMNEGLSVQERDAYQELAALHQLGQGYFPIHLEAKAFDQVEKKSLMELICQMAEEELGEADETEVADLVRRYNQEGKLLLLLDAFDEVEESKQKFYVNKLNAFLKSAEGDRASVILTTRPMGLIKGLEGFVKWKIEPLSMEQDEALIAKLIQNYSAKSFNQISYTKACQMIKENDYLKPLVVSPYLIMWSVLYLSEDKKPAEIIGNVVNSLIMRQKIEYKDIRQDARALLEWISYQMLSRNGEPCFEIDRNRSSLQEVFGEGLEELRNLRQFKGAFRHYEDMNQILNIVNVKVGIMIPMGTKLVFQARELFPAYLAAWWIERLAYEHGEEKVMEALEEIHASYRYEVVEMLLSIMFSHCNKTGVIGPREMVDISEMIMDHLLLQYVKTLEDDEREKIADTCVHIIDGYFGENDISRNNQIYQKIVKRLLKD